jgi:hypothetical protein
MQFHESELSHFFCKLLLYLHDKIPSLGTIKINVLGHFRKIVPLTESSLCRRRDENRHRRYVHKALTASCRSALSSCRSASRMAETSSPPRTRQRFPPNAYAAQSRMRPSELRNGRRATRLDTSPKRVRQRRESHAKSAVLSKRQRGAFLFFFARGAAGGKWPHPARRPSRLPPMVLRAKFPYPMPPHPGAAGRPKPIA